MEESNIKSFDSSNQTLFHGNERHDSSNNTDDNDADLANENITSPRTAHVTDTKIGLFTVWSIGTGAAVGGDFFGWQLILSGGFGYACIALLIAGVFYWIYANAITELAARYKTSGGAFDFVYRALGPEYGAWMAILGMFKLILANSANALAIGSYLHSSGMIAVLESPVWISFYIFFTALDCIGVKQSASVQNAATFFCVAIVVFFVCCSMAIFKKDNLNEISNDGGSFFEGLAFALPCFDGFEDVPLLISYTENPNKTIPRAMSLCYFTVLFLAIGLVLFGTAANGREVLLDSSAPLMPTFESLFTQGSTFCDIIGNLIVIGLVVNFFAFIIFGSQQLQAVADAGQLPSYLKYRHPVHGSPIYASLTLCAIGITITLIFFLIFGEEVAQNVLITASLVPAVLGYILVLQAVIEVIKYENSKHIQ